MLVILVIVYTINMFDHYILRFSTARVTHNLNVIYYGAAR